MKIIAIGDIHGRDIWKKILAAERSFDKVVFIGDYFDSREMITRKKQIANFKDIIALKAANPLTVTLLVGNHDFHYLGSIDDRYTGYNENAAYKITKLVDEAFNKQQFQMCLIVDNFLFSHAGLTKTWCNNHLTITEFVDSKVLENEVNDLFYCFPEQFVFTEGDNKDDAGNDVTQSPIWVRPNSLKVDKINDYIQIVGHTEQDEVTVDNDIVLIDALGTCKGYLVIEDGVLIGKKLKL